MLRVGEGRNEGNREKPGEGREGATEDFRS